MKPFVTSLSSSLLLPFVILNGVAFASDGYTTLKLDGASATELFNALNVQEEYPDQLGGNPGINPLLKQKEFRSSDETVIVRCEMRFATRDCSVSLIPKRIASGHVNGVNTVVATTTSAAAIEIADSLYGPNVVSRAGGIKFFSSTNKKFAISCRLSNKPFFCSFAKSE